MFRRELTITHLFECASGDRQNAASIHDIQNLQFQPYCVDGREGVSIFYLYDARQDAQGSVSALVRYAAGALTPRHQHAGWELVLVLDGELIDDRGSHAPGVLQVYPPGSTHELSSKSGCTFLVVWEQPVHQVLDEACTIDIASTLEGEV